VWPCFLALAFRGDLSDTMTPLLAAPVGPRSALGAPVRRDSVWREASASGGLSHRQWKRATSRPYAC
jgi:hypothetical protein